MNTEAGQTPEFDVLWDTVLSDLENNNETLIETCPALLKNFINNATLFNCPVLCSTKNPAEYQFVVGSSEQGKIYFVGYETIAEIIVNEHQGPAFEISKSPLWLYDEFHKVENHYEHHIIFSDGKEFIIPFIFFQYRETEWFKNS
jgi:hypothetical protein